MNIRTASFAIGLLGLSLILMNCGKPPESTTGANSENRTSVNAAKREITTDELLNKFKNRDGKPLFVNFWATWCDPCKEEMPHIVELYQQYGNDQVEFLAVSLDSITGTVDQVELTTERNNMKMPVVILDMKNQNQEIEAIDPDWGGELPFTLVISANGEKSEAFSGGQTKETFETAIKKVIP